MNKLLVILITSSLFLTSPLAQAWEPDTSNKLELSVKQALIKAEKTDPAMAKWFEEAYAYAVLPRVGKGGIGIGGAHGKGLVIHGDRTVGKTSMSQITIGFQLGGQVYAEYIMFKDKTAFDHFTRGNFESWCVCRRQLRWWRGRIYHRRRWLDVRSIYRRPEIQIQSQIAATTE